VAKDTARLKTHLILKHNIGTKDFICNECGKRYCTNDRLKEHVRSHLKIFKYICEKCGNGFNRPSRLKNHIVKCNGTPPKEPVTQLLDDSQLEQYISRVDDKRNTNDEAQDAINSISSSQQDPNESSDTPRIQYHYQQQQQNFFGISNVKRVEELAQNANTALRRVEESALDATSTLRRIEETSLNASSQLRQVEEAALNAHTTLRRAEETALSATATLRRVEDSSLNATTILRRVEESTFNSTSELRKAEGKLMDASAKLSQLDPTKDSEARERLGKLDGEIVQVREDISELRSNQLEIMQKLHALEELITKNVSQPKQTETEP